MSVCPHWPELCSSCGGGIENLREPDQVKRTLAGAAHWNHSPDCKKVFCCVDRATHVRLSLPVPVAWVCPWTLPLAPPWVSFKPLPWLHLRSTLCDLLLTPREYCIRAWYLETPCWMNPSKLSLTPHAIVSSTAKSHIALDAISSAAHIPSTHSVEHPSCITAARQMLRVLHVPAPAKDRSDAGQGVGRVMDYSVGRMRRINPLCGQRDRTTLRRISASIKCHVKNETCASLATLGVS